MDIIIRNGAIIDGTGKQRFSGDIGITGDRISDVGDLSKAEAPVVIDAKDKIVAPGFVDILSHADSYLTLFSVPGAESLLRQGVTTILGGNCGASLAPLVHGNIIASVQKWGDIRDMTVNWERFSELLAEFERRGGFGVNFGSLVGHATLRRGLVGDDPRALTEAELLGERKLLEDALEEGAFGLSFAPAYAHAKEVPQEEIDALLKPVSSGKRLFSMHVRNEGPDIQLAVSEAIGYAERNFVNLEISHFKVVGRRFWEFEEAALTTIDEAAARGVAVHFDCYPYITMTIVGYLLLPVWAATGGRRYMLERLRNRDIRRKIIEEMRQEARWDYETMRVGIAHRDRTFSGKLLSDIALRQGVTNEEAALNLLLANEGRVIMFARALSAAGVRKRIHHERSFVASAGGGYDMAWAGRGELVHPRSFGAFPRVLGKLVRRERLLSLEEAVWKMSGGPAQKIGIKDRGVLERGAYADIVVFDPERIADRATPDAPYRFPIGIERVIVNGKVAVNEKGLTGVRAGNILKAR